MNEWDKLWEKLPMAKRTNEHMAYWHYSEMGDFLDKVKAEGDKLQKHNAFLLNEVDNYSEALNLKVEKLEAIHSMWSEMPKAYMVKYNDDVGEFDSDSYNEDIQAWRETWMELMDDD